MAQTQRDVTLYYEGSDITDDVDIIECVLKDVSGGESDCLNLKVDHAEKWFRWGPAKNDRLRVTRGGYDSKTLYLNTVVPEDGAYRIFATAARCAPAVPRWQTFEDMTLSAVMGICAGEMGMGSKVSGLNGGVTYEYLLRSNERAPAFLEKIVNREGGVLKALDGRFVGIGVSYAQGLPPMHRLELDSGQLDSEYIDRRDMKWSGVTIRTPFGNGEARDGSADGQTRTITDITVDDDAMAYRWAKGILMARNRQAEILNIEMDFNPGYTAMVRIDVASGTDAAGEWVIDRVEQNMLDGRTKARMLRCVTSIA